MTFKKHDYDKTLTRLISILSKLYVGESLSVKALAEEFNVSERTISRDFNQKLVANFPIYQDKKLWKMRDGFKLEKSTSIEDTVVLGIMEKLIEGAGTKFASKAKKLLSKIKNEEFNPIFTKLNLEEIGDKLEVVHLLESAIKSKQEIEYFYEIKINKILKAHVKPIKLANFEGFWYLLGQDINNENKLKKYVLRNISKIKILDKKFEVEKKIEESLNNALSAWFNDENEPFEVKIHISSVVAKYFERIPISPTQIIESIYDDGSKDMIIKITHEMEIIPLVKYWVPHIKIISPLSIQETIENELKMYLDI